MKALITHSARAAAAATGLIFAIGLGAALVRLLPWLVAPEVPWRICAPFAALLAGSAFEVAILIGVPLGFGVGAALFVERGEALALLALGASPSRLVLGLVAPGLMIVALGAGVGAGRGSLAAGGLFTHLVDEGHGACESRSSRRRVDVPLTSLSWLCLHSGARLAGRIPGFPGPLWFSATNVIPSEDLGALVVSDVGVAGELGQRTLEFRARRVRITGLSTWGSSASALGGWRRGGLLSGGALLIALLAALLMIRETRGHPLVAAIIVVPATVVMLALVHALDARVAPAAAYMVAPAAGVLFLFAANRLARVAPNRSG